MIKRILLTCLALAVVGGYALADGRGPVNGILRALGFSAQPTSGTSGSLTIFEDPANGGQSLQVIVPSLTSDQVCTATDAGFTGANCQIGAGGGVTDYLVMGTATKLTASPLAADTRLDIDDVIKEVGDAFDYSAGDGSVTVSEAGDWRISLMIKPDLDWGATTDCAAWRVEINGTATNVKVVSGNYQLAGHAAGAGNSRSRETQNSFMTDIITLAASDVVAVETPATDPCGGGSTWPDIELHADGAYLMLEKL